MIRDIGSSIGNAIFENLGRAAGRMQEKRPLPADLLESDDAYLVVFDAPGTAASDVQVRYVEDRVEVRVDRFREFYEGFDMRYPGRGLALDGSVRLPGDADVDPQTAEARLKENGTLHVRVPKVESSQDSDDGTVAAGGGEDDAAETDESGESDESNESSEEWGGLDDVQGNTAASGEETDE